MQQLRKYIIKLVVANGSYASNGLLTQRIPQISQEHEFHFEIKREQSLDKVAFGMTVIKTLVVFEEEGRSKLLPSTRMELRISSL